MYKRQVLESAAVISEPRTLDAIELQASNNTLWYIVGKQQELWATGAEYVVLHILLLAEILLLVISWFTPVSGLYAPVP